jgi:hypothetical protein
MDRRNLVIRSLSKYLSKRKASIEQTAKMPLAGKSGEKEAGENIFSCILSYQYLFLTWTGII